MIFKNKYNLPKNLCKALVNDDYPHHPDNVISCTSLIDAPKNKILQRRHDADIEVDVAERAWIVFGNAIHYYLEKSAGADSLVEERWYLDTKTWEVYTCNAGNLICQEWYKLDTVYVSGQFDHYEDGVLSDYKATSTWSVTMNTKPKPEHVWQLNINALAMRALNFEIQKLLCILVLRDFKKSETGKGNYPRIPFHVWNIRVMTDSAIKTHITARVEKYVQCMKLDDDLIPACSEEERWNRGPLFKVFKNNNKRAVNGGGKFTDILDATEFKQQLQSENPKDKYKIEEFPTKNTRCEDGYCLVTKWCHFYKKTYGEKQAS